MARITKPLTNTEVERAKPKDKDYSLMDGQGLFLRVKPNGVKSWLFNYYKPYSTPPKRTNLGIGTYPDISLAQARIIRDEWRALLAKNIDPKVYRQNIVDEEISKRENTLNWVSDGDDQKKMRVLAALYMILTNRYEWQLFLEITGEGGTGKSVFNHLAKILAGGDDNTAALSLKDLESPTMRCGLIDKTLCYSPDQESYIGDGGVLRSITGGDSVSFRPLYRSAFKDIVKAIFLITGNSPIIFKEQKGGTSRRRVIFQFNKVVNESDKDYHLKDKLEQEAGGIVRLLLDTFPEPMAAKQLLEEQKASEEAIKVKEESDHILQFAKYFEAKEIINGLTLGSSRKEGAHRTALHSSYLYFCDRMGIINPLQRNRFRQAFEHALKERGSPQPLRTRIKDGINVTNIYYIDMMNTLRDWDN